MDRFAAKSNGRRRIRGVRNADSDLLGFNDRQTNVMQIAGDRGSTNKLCTKNIAQRGLKGLQGSQLFTKGVMWIHN